MRLLPHKLSILLVACWTGCSASPPIADALQLPPDSQRLHRDHLPTPFRAAQIRDAFQNGGAIRMRIEEKGQPTVYENITFRANASGQITGVAWMESLDGKVIGSRQSFPVDWKALQSQASYPASKGQIKTARIQTPLGTFATLLYEVQGATAGEVEKSWFAPSLPGPPVLQVRTIDGEEVYRSTRVTR